MIIPQHLHDWLSSLKVFVVGENYPSLVLHVDVSHYLLYLAYQYLLVKFPDLLFIRYTGSSYEPISDFHRGISNRGGILLGIPDIQAQCDSLVDFL